MSAKRDLLQLTWRMYNDNYSKADRIDRLEYIVDRFRSNFKIYKSLTDKLFSSRDELLSEREDLILSNKDSLSDQKVLLDKQKYLSLLYVDLHDENKDLRIKYMKMYNRLVDLETNKYQINFINRCLIFILCSLIIIISIYLFIRSSFIPSIS